MDSSGIHIEDCEDVIAKGNIIKGYDKGIDAKRVKNLKIEGNEIIEAIEPETISNENIEELKIIINDFKEINSEIKSELKGTLDKLKNKENNNRIKSTLQKFMSTLIANQVTPENFESIIDYFEKLFK